MSENSVEQNSEKLIDRILILNNRIWEGRVGKIKIQKWLENFNGQVASQEVEHLHALYWLSQFMYFGGREIRVLLQSLYRDLYLCPMIQEVRKSLRRSSSESLLEEYVQEEMNRTCFIGVGNPSESGVHLLYYFRQENNLPKDCFIDAVQLFKRAPRKANLIESLFHKVNLWTGKGNRNRLLSRSNLTLRNPRIQRYVFLDDICGSGDTAAEYSEQVLLNLFELDPDAKVSYLCLFATIKGLEYIRKNTLFKENCAAVYELDTSYRCLSNESRYLRNPPEFIDPKIARELAIKYGEQLNSDYACGYKNSQMLIGFHHNTPDNTIGIMWQDIESGAEISWNPIFKRYPKIYGGGFNE